VVLAVIPWLLAAAVAPKIVELFKAQCVACESFMLVDDVDSPTKPVARATLHATKSGPLLSFNDSSGKGKMLIGCIKTRKLGEVQAIIWETSAGRQVLAPDENGKITWTKE
jgi:hypothetical protein